MKITRLKSSKKFLFVVIFALVSIFGWLTSTSDSGRNIAVSIIRYTNGSSEPRRLECLVSKRKNLTCLKWSNKYYVPFELLRDKFDVQSKVEESGRLKLKFTTSKVFMPSAKYDHRKEYLWFSRVNVEPRDRVLRMSLRHGVPISNQWNKSGHIYPIQVAQYGLSHLSRWTERSNSNTEPCQFDVDDHNYFIHNQARNSRFTKTRHGFGFSFLAHVSTTSRFNLTIDLKISTPNLTKLGRVIYSFHNSINDTESIEYSNPADFFTTLFLLKSPALVTGLKLYRDLCIDVCKSVHLKCDWCSKRDDFVRVYQVGLSGDGQITDGLLYASLAPGLKQAEAAGSYLVSSQREETGGWLINTTRRFDKVPGIQLPTGWYSAMAQGQAISLLCRLYSVTGNATYLSSATKALGLFDVAVASGGVRASLFGSAWLEEYPTRPSSLFVLNGFIYAVFGLGDYLAQCSNRSDVERLFRESVDSLVRHVNMYDTGTRTLYDLRHLASLEIGPNVARWDYHTLHVSQLYYLVELLGQLGFDSTKRNSLKRVAFRWHNYVYGKWNQNSQIMSS